jgi:hypothetical protein
MQGGDETDPVCFGARHLSQHRLATRGPSLSVLQRVIHTTFVKIDEVVGLHVGQLMLKLCAGALVAFGVPKGFFFE